MQEDEEDRIARLAREKEEKALHKLTKLANALKMDVMVLKEMEEKSKVSRKVLRLGTKQKAVVWRRRGIMKTEVEHIANVLSFQRLIGREVLTNLDLRTNLACRDGAEILAKCLKDCALLTRLDLSENNIGDAGCEELTTLLHPKGTLQKLEVAGNKIGIAGTSALARALPDAPHLTHLGLSGNQLCHAGLRPLCDVAFGHLQTLDVRANVIDDRAATVLASGIVACESITFIDIRENVNSHEATAILGKAQRDRIRKYKDRVRQERRQAKKEKRKFAEPDPLPELQYYWVEPHQLRAVPGNSAVANALSRACVIC